MRKLTRNEKATKNKKHSPWASQMRQIVTGQSYVYEGGVSEQEDSGMGDLHRRRRNKIR